MKTALTPTVTNVNPSTGSIAGTDSQQSITITGTNFTGASAVYFNGVPSPAYTVSVDGTTITAAAPPNPAGQIDVQVNTPVGGKSVACVGDKYTYECQINTVSPSSGPLAGSGNVQTVTLTGIGFTYTSQVLFNGIPVSKPNFRIISDLQITTSVPAGSATGTVDIQVSTNFGLSAKTTSDQYTYESKPAITSLGTPTGENTGDTTVVINGTGLIGATSVLFGNNPATIQPGGTDTSITVLSPAGNGTVDVTVVTPDGTTPIVAADQFMYTTIPLTFSIPDDVATMGIYFSMYGVLEQQYINYASTSIPSGANVILISTGTGYDYIEASSVSSGNQIPAFMCLNQPTTDFTLNIPNVNIKAARVVIGINGTPPYLSRVAAASNGNTLPQPKINASSVTGFSTSGGVLYICTNSGMTTVNYTGITGSSFTGCTGGSGILNTGMIIISRFMETPTVNDSTGDVSAPTPLSQLNNIYDFFEFTYLPVNGLQTMTINTSAIDQFGFPIRLKVSGRSVQPGNEVGVYIDRTTVINNFSAAVGTGPYSELIYPSKTANPVVRILSPSDQLDDNPVKGLSVVGGKVSGNSLTSGTYSYVVAANNVYAPPLLAQTTLSSTENTVTITWGGTSGTEYNVYRGVPNGNSITWYLIAPQITGSTCTDAGPATSGTAQDPSFDPLGKCFDQAINELFTSENLILLTVTDGSSNPANGYQYTFSGFAKQSPAWLNQATGTEGNQVIEFSCIAINNHPQQFTPLIPIGSLFYVFAPFFNTNTVNPSNPNPPVWNGKQMLFSGSFPTAMAFGADGVFADNLQQSAALYASLTQTTIASGSNNQILPQATIQVASTARFQPVGVFYIMELNVLINYTGISGNSFTGCTGGKNIILTTGMHIYGPLQLATVSGTQTLPNTSILASGTTGYPAEGTLYIWATGAATPIPVTYTGTSGNSFTGCTGGTGTIPDGSFIAVNNCQPIGLEQNAYSVAVGSLEDALNAAILRGVASSMNSVNWANAPTNPTASAGPTTVTNTSTYYYVITTVNSSGESTPSEEVSYATSNTSILLNWAPVNGATSYNIYRGSTAGEENILVSNTTNTSFEDKLASATLPQGTPPVSGITTAPANLRGIAAAQNGGQLSQNTYYYVVTALGYTVESIGSNEVNVQVGSGMNAVTLNWDNVANASAYKIYRGTTAGQENILAGILPGNNSPLSFTDGNNAGQTPPPNVYYALGAVSDSYAQFFHQTSVSVAGLAYADPYDDQGGQSSTLTAVSPTGVAIKLISWTTS